MKISSKTQTDIVQAYLDSSMTQQQIAEKFGVSHSSVARALRLYKEGGISFKEATEKHQAAMEQKRAEHADATKWMEHITPLHLHKQRLEAEIEKRQEALDQARQEYRNFLATIEQLTKEER